MWLAIKVKKGVSYDMTPDPNTLFLKPSMGLFIPKNFQTDTIVAVTELKH